MCYGYPARLEKRSDKSSIKVGRVSGCVWYGMVMLWSG